MSVIVTFGKVGFKSGKKLLFGEYKAYPVYALRLGFFSVIFLGKGARNVLHTAMRGVIQDKDWLIENAQSVRLARRKAEAKCRAQAEHEFRGRLDYAESRLSKLSNQLGQAQNDLRAMKTAIKLVGGQ